MKPCLNHLIWRGRGLSIVVLIFVALQLSTSVQALAQPNKTMDFQLVVREDAPITNIQIGGNTLYYSIEPAANCLLRRVSVAGGPATTLTSDAYTYEAGDRYGIMYFNVLGDTIFGGYGGYGQHVVFKVPASGGARDNLRTTTGGYYISASPTHVFFGGDFSKIWRMNRDGSADQTVTTDDWVRNRAVDGEKVFYLEYRSRALRSFNMSNSAVVTLGYVGTDCGVFVDDTYAYVWDGTTRRIPKTGGTFVSVSADPSFAASCSDGVYVYGNMSHTSVVRMPAQGGPGEILVEPTGEAIQTVAVSGGYVYWVASAGSQWSVYRMSLQAWPVQAECLVDNTCAHDYDDLCGVGYAYDDSAEIRVYTREGIQRGGRGLLKFDLSAIPAGTAVREARLRLFATLETEYVSNAFHVSRVLEDWNTDQMSWCDRFNGLPWCTQGVCFTGEHEAVTTIPSKYANYGYGSYGEWIEWDVTEIVRDWTGQGAPNYGLCVWQTDIANVGWNQEIHFASREHSQSMLYAPQLIISAGEAIGIADVPEDDGGWISVNWSRFAEDLDGIPGQVLRYVVQRQDGGWSALDSVPAVQSDVYSKVVPTPDILTLGQPAPCSRYRVVGRTADPLVFYQSLPDSGYSIDNLPPPAAVLSVLDDEASRTVYAAGPHPSDYRETCFYSDQEPGFTPGEPIHCSISRYYDEMHLRTYYYKARVFDIHGNPSEWSNEVTGQYPTGAPGTAITQLRLYPNQPNPFNPKTEIRFDLPAAGNVRLSVYDLAGRLVKVLVEGEIPAGSHEAVWDGRDATGHSAPSGSYLARLVAGGKVVGVRLSLVR